MKKDFEVEQMAVFWTNFHHVYTRLCLLSVAISKMTLFHHYVYADNAVVFNDSCILYGTICHHYLTTSLIFIRLIPLFFYILVMLISVWMLQLYGNLTNYAFDIADYNDMAFSDVVRSTYFFYFNVSDYFCEYYRPAIYVIINNMLH